MSRARAALIERVAGAWRDRDPFGTIKSSPVWHDLDDEGRAEAYRISVELRRLEAAADPDGLSSTAHAVLARIYNP